MSEPESNKDIDAIRPGESAEYCLLRVAYGHRETDEDRAEEVQRERRRQAKLDRLNRAAFVQWGPRWRQPGDLLPVFVPREV